ncbi:MAG: hypothetical protein JW760_10135 [Spirochaetales bacterium]|nr:hypothetical protein [Spirochaetales bacterium]
MKIILRLLTFITLALVTACAGAPAHIEENLAPAEYFQRAQEAMGSRDDYKTALVYYTTFLERFPEDTQRVVEAEYEIAFIHYVQGDFITAEKEFRALLDRYNQPEAEALPKWPRVLAEKLLIEIAIKKENED